MKTAETVFENGIYDRAVDRVIASAELGPHFDTIIINEWSNAEDHFRWVCDASEAEILQWLDSLR